MFYGGKWRWFTYVDTPGSYQRECNIVLWSLLAVRLFITAEVKHVQQFLRC